jgi:hypothetical protein
MSRVFTYEYYFFRECGPLPGTQEHEQPKQQDHERHEKYRPNGVCIKIKTSCNTGNITPRLDTEEPKVYDKSRERRVHYDSETFDDTCNILVYCKCKSRYRSHW